MRRYREILALPGALRFSAAGLLARAGGAMNGLGLVLMVSAQYGSYGLAGALTAANAVAWALGTAVLSNLVDRFGQRRVMYPAAMVSGATLALVVVLALVRAPIWALVGPVVISGATGGAPGALVRARWSHLTSEPAQLHTAYSLESTLDEVVFAVGPVLATALATGVHPVAGLVAPVLTTVVGARLFYSQRATEPPVVPRHPDAPPRRWILLFGGVAAVVSVNLLIGAVFGSIDVSVVAAATAWDHRAASGLVLAALSTASGVAGLLFGARTWTWSLTSRFTLGVVAMAMAAAALTTADSVLRLVLVGLLVGSTVAPTLISSNGLIGHLVPRDRLTEGLAWMGTGLGIGVSIGSAAAGRVIDSAGYHGGFVTVAACAVLAATIVLASWRTLRRTSAQVAGALDA